MPLDLPFSKYLTQPLICALLIASWDRITKNNFTYSEIFTDSLVMASSVLITDIVKQNVIDKFMYSNSDVSNVLTRVAMSTFLYQYLYRVTIGELSYAGVMGLPSNVELALTGALIFMLSNYLQDPAQELLHKII
jgi:hypothetical protein